MILTPPDFEPLIAAMDHPVRRTLVFRRHEVLVREEEYGLPHEDTIESLGLEPSAIHPVGLWRGEYFRAAWLEGCAEAPPAHLFKGMRALWGRFEEPMLGVMGRAFQIAEWARTHRFCGACGAPMALTPGERAMRCACGHTAYPRISPAMMVLIKRGEAILLARNIAAPPGRMSALAGFLEAGESVEEAIHREVREEVGLEVKDLRYFASQPWAFPHSLMLAFTAEYAGGELALDQREIVEAAWFGPGDQLPQLSPTQSISRALIEANLPPGARR